MNQKIKKKIIHLTPSKELLNIAGKKPYTVLAEKFLLSSHEKAKIVLRALAEEKQRMNIFGRSMTFFPLGIFAYFFIPDEFYSFIFSEEIYVKTATAIILGCLFCNALVLDRIGMRAVLIIPLTFIWIFSFAPDSFFRYLFIPDDKLRLFFCIGSGFILPPLIYFPSYGFWHFYKWLSGFESVHKIPFFAKYFDWSGERETEALLHQALAHSADVNAKEFAQLVHDYAPGLTSMLEALPHEEIDLPDTIEARVTKPSQPKNMHLPIYMGVKEGGEHLYEDLIDMPHMCVGGATRSGKTNWLKHIVGELLAAGNAELILIDPTRLAFSKFKHNPNVSYTHDVSDAKTMVSDLLDEMEERNKKFVEAGVEDLQEYAKGDIPYKVVIIDEYLSFYEDKVFTKQLMHIATIGRKYGIHLIVATQRPDAKVLHEQIRANLPATIAFAVRDHNNARVLGAPGAEKIKKNQKGLCYYVDGSDKILLQTPLAQIDQWTKRTNRLVQGGQKVVKYIGQSDQGGQKVVTAEKNDPDAFFVSSKELQSLIGGNPSGFGFVQTRVQVDGEYKRGYWVKRKN